ncbi:hypothetical protein TWF192_000697 [Orbilia oligospora]|nr:hypothetical protein TWF192_000697 [Orbilia oligospora]
MMARLGPSAILGLPGTIKTAAKDLDQPIRKDWEVLDFVPIVVIIVIVVMIRAFYGVSTDYGGFIEEYVTVLVLLYLVRIFVSVLVVLVFVTLAPPLSSVTVTVAK